MNKLRKFLLKKNKGESELFTNIVTIMIICSVLIFFLDFYSDLTYKDGMDLLARKYLLVLETTNTIDGNAILEDIDRVTGGDGSKTFSRWKAAPTVTVVVNGTPQVISATQTTVNAQYGDNIALVIKGEYQSATSQWTSMFSKSDDPTYVEFSVVKESVAKH